MKIRLIELTLKDFAGVKKESFNFEGKDAKIYGDNATGKTTTAVALNWLLFDKGLEGQKIDIVPKDNNNEHIHERVPTVEAIFDMNGNEMILKRESHPNYEKVEGSTKKHYKKSRTTKQYIDEVPYPITKFKNAINDIINEEVFKLVTNPDAFAQLHWQEKRKILFEIAGDISDEDIINSNAELKDLLEVIQKRDLEDEKKVINDQLKKSREDLEHIPVKINTLNEQLSDEKFDETELDKTLVRLNDEIDALKEQREDVKHGGAVIEVKREIEDINYKMNVLKRDIETNTKDKVDSLQRDLDNLELEIKMLERRKTAKLGDNGNLAASKEAKLKEYRELVDEIERVRDEAFVMYSDASHCSHCGQTLPEHDAKKLIEHAQAEFNKKKSDLLESYEYTKQRIVEEGKKLTEQIENNEEDIKTIENDIKERETKFKEVSAYLKEAENNVSKAENNGEYKALRDKRASLESKLSDERATTEDKVKELRNQIDNKQDRIVETLKRQGRMDHQRNLKKSIEDYRKEEGSILDTIEQLKYRKHLIDQFTKTKVNLITEKVNDMFDIARFKLFHQQVNGDISDTCQIMVDGVIYDGGLNNAMRINVGLDIIKTLSSHFNAEAMIFIDNAEAVTKLNDTDAQQIQLIVSENDKNLRMITL